MQFKPGSLIRLRERDWIVLPSPSDDVLVAKPLGGSDAEIAGIYLPLNIEAERPSSTSFPLPSVDDLSDLAGARLLYDACRLSFRNAAGPFRCIGKLSFRPRAYQMVPLIMALRQAEPIRLFIADDVGVGKTIEAGLIVRELLERREIERFAVVCLPHLCDQWQEELIDKFGIDAVIVRSSTAASLDRQIRGDQSIFKYFPYQVISIDYIKSEQRRQVFLSECPDLVVLDEVHSCARPQGAKTAQQQRYHLVHDIAAKNKQHLVMLTATPHSGKQDEFQSLLGFLNPKFESLDLTVANEDHKKAVAKQFIQRKRDDVVRWMGEETVFPERIPDEHDYPLSPSYHDLFLDVLQLARGLAKEDGRSRRIQRVRYWAALALLRGVMSSPDAGSEMLKKRAAKVSDQEFLAGFEDSDENPILDSDYHVGDDTAPTHIVENATFTSSESKLLSELAAKAEALGSLEKDYKAKRAVGILREWLKKRFNPIVFCRYIATAKYLGKVLIPELQKEFPNLRAEVITSEDPDDLRRKRIDAMTGEPRLLFATDCLSEGINLQDFFNAVMHYDLPWNPNRLEQREGRVDRFGQQSSKVLVSLLFGKDNPIDGVVLEVLLRKARQIRRSNGITIPFPEDSKSIMDAVLTAVLLNPKSSELNAQQNLDFGETPEVAQKQQQVITTYEAAAVKHTAIRSIFAQRGIKAEEIEKDLKEVDEAIGDVKAVEQFVLAGVRYLGAQIEPYKEGYRLVATNLPVSLRQLLTQETELVITFKSPTPKGYRYIGRNHLFVEQLTQILMADALNAQKRFKPSRAAVVRTTKVQSKVVLFQFRVRNVIAEARGGAEIIAEEMLLSGYRGESAKKEYLGHLEAKDLLLSALGPANIEREEQEHWLTDELKQLGAFNEWFDTIALERANHLVEAHERFRKIVGGKKFKAVEPVLPMDIMGVYVLLPQIKH